MYSYSKLSTYNQCPLKYKYSYIDKIKTNTPLCFIKGRKIHKEFELLNESNITNASNIVKNFLNSNIGNKLKNILLKNKTKREFKFGLDTDFKNCKYNLKCYYGGIIDLIYIDDLLTLVDYKTGNYKELKYQDFYQLMSYSLFFFNNKNIDQIKLKYIYVEHNLENSLIIKRDSIEFIKNWIKNTINKIENDTQFLKNKTKLCNYCQYKNICK